MSRKPLMLVGDVPVGAVESAENSGKTAPGSGMTLVETGNTEEATFTARVNVVYKITLRNEVCVKKSNATTWRETPEICASKYRSRRYLKLYNLALNCKVINSNTSPDHLRFW